MTIYIISLVFLLPWGCGIVRQRKQATATGTSAFTCDRCWARRSHSTQSLAWIRARWWINAFSEEVVSSICIHYQQIEHISKSIHIYVLCKVIMCIYSYLHLDCMYLYPPSNGMYVIQCVCFRDIPNNNSCFSQTSKLIHTSTSRCFCRGNTGTNTHTK